MGNKYFTKGLGSYQSYKIAIKRKYLLFTAEPFILNVLKEPLEENNIYPNYYTPQDQVVRPSERPGGFKWLNDRPLNSVSEQKDKEFESFSFI